MSSLIYVKNEQQLRFIRQKMSHALTPLTMYLTVDPQVWYELASDNKAVLWAGDCVGDDDWMKIEDEALSLRDGWYRPIEQSLFYEGINLAELIRLEHTHFFRQASRARMILERIFNEYAVRNVILVDKCEIPCRDSNRVNNKNGVFEGVLLWEAQKRGLQVQLLTNKQPPEKDSITPLSEKSRSGRVFAFDCWQDNKSLKLIGVGAGFHLAVLEPFVRAWNNQPGCEGILLNLKSLIENLSGRAQLRECTRFTSLVDFSTYDQSVEYVQTQRCLLDALDQWKVFREELDDAHILKNPHLNFHWTSIWHSLTRLPLSVQKAFEAIRIMSPDVVLTDEMVSSSIRVFTEAAKKKGILTVDCPHGYVGGIEEFEPHGDLYLAWGAESKRQLAGRFTKNTAPIVVTGSPVNEKVIKSPVCTPEREIYERTRLSPHKKTICVVTRYIFGNVWPVNIREFFSRCNEIVSLASRSDIQVIIKVSPRADHIELYKQIFGSHGNIYICTEYTLDELLPIIDVGIMLFYVGTASLLFLHKKIPTIFIINRNIVSSTDVTWRVFDDTQPLSELCNRFLYDSKAKQQRLMSQKQFAEQHLHINDDDAAQRAALNVKDALKSSRRPTKRNRQRQDILTTQPSQTEPGQIGCLAIFAPHFGAVSETFITRQIDNIVPGRTVVVTKEICEGVSPAVPCLVTPYSGGVTVYYSEVEEQVVRFLSEHKVTHILCEYGCRGQSIVELNRRRLHLPIFVHFHGYDAASQLRDPEMVMYYKWMGTRVTGVIAVSNKMAARLAAIGIPAGKIRVIPYGVEVPPSICTVPEKQPCRFVSVTRMVPKKSPLLLLQAFKKVHEHISDCTLDVIGDGTLFAEAKRFVNTNGLGNSVMLHGARSNEEVMEYMYASCVYVQHSITDPETGDAEGLPNSILEASLAGLPIVSTLHEGIPDEVEHGVTGFLVEEGDVDGMADYILKLAQNPQMRKTMGMAAYKKVAAEFNLQLWMQRLYDFLTSSDVNDIHVIHSNYVTPAKAGIQSIERNRIPSQAHSDRPKVSIIMSCYNCERFIRESLDSILAQTMSQWELFLLDDNSTDGTRNIIGEYSAKDNRIKPFYFDSNEGPYVRRNFAITRADSDFIMIHDADDIMVTNKMERLYQQINADGRLAIVGSGYLNFVDRFTGPQYTESYGFPAEHNDIVNGLLSGRHTLCHAAGIIKKELFDAIGLYDENRWGADAFWLAKVAEYVHLTGRFRLKNIPESLMLRRIHLTSQSIQVGLWDPRGARKLYIQYYQDKLKRTVNSLKGASLVQIESALKNCMCSDFTSKYAADIEKLNRQAIDFRIVGNLLQHAVAMFDKGRYISCVAALNNAEGAGCDLVKRLKNCDLLKGACYFALDLKDECTKFVRREIDNHDNPAAKQFLADLGKQPVTDVENWYLENGKRYDLRVTASSCPEQDDLRDRSSQLNKLTQQLAQRGWQGKFPSYQKFFDYVAYLQRIAAPTISVVVVSWRLHPDTITCLETLIRQRSENFELVFVDNGAEQGEFKCLEPFVDTYIRLNRNTGACTARNLGTAFANGRLLLFLDDEGIPEADILRSYREAFDKYVAIVVRGSIWPKDKNAAPYTAHRYYGDRPFPYFCCPEGNSAYKASTFYLAGGWDDLISGGKGIDLARRLVEIEPDMRKQIYWPKAILYHGKSEEKEDWDDKKRLREASLELLKHKHPDYGIFQECYKKYYQRDDLLIRKNSRGLPIIGAERVSDHLYHNQELFRSFRRMQQKSGPSGQVLALNDRGAALMADGDKAGALTAFETAIKIDPSFVQAHNNLGLLHRRMGDIRKAMRCFINAFSLDPTDHNTVSNICRLYRQMGWTAEAEALRRKCVSREALVSSVPDNRQQHPNAISNQPNHMSRS